MTISFSVEENRDVQQPLMVMCQRIFFPKINQGRI